MNLSYLKYAVEVEKTGSITKAAQNFYMNQPHLSKIIRELERELGEDIFDRTSSCLFYTSPFKASAASRTFVLRF